MLTFLRSLAFNIYVRLSSILIFIICLPFVVFGKKSTFLACKIWAYNVVYAAKYIAGINFAIKGTIPSGGVVFACKHQSAWETAVFHVIAKHPVYVFKKELLYIPVFGFYLLVSGQICVNRKAGASAIKNLIKDVRKRMESQQPVIIFPEGTRRAFGAEPDYKAGIAALYSSVEADIVPVALNSGKFWARQSFWKKSGTITISFLPPIAKDLSKQEFMQTLEAQIENECKTIEAIKY
jgi:1-acyl-sn-glycerol-3-phosphate acyltransferase